MDKNINEKLDFKQIMDYKDYFFKALPILKSIYSFLKSRVSVKKNRKNRKGKKGFTKSSYKKNIKQVIFTFSIFKKIYKKALNNNIL